MESTSFFKKFLNPFLLLNILAMAIIVILLSMGLRYGLDLYTHHGQTVEVPSILHKTYNDAEDLINIGAYKAGANKNIDYAVSKIDAVNNFLMQETDEKFSYEEVVAQLEKMFADSR